MRILILSFITILSLSACRESNSEDKITCTGKQWNSPEEYLDCKFPFPPVGRWHAVYSKEFAEEYNFPEENISKDLSSGVDYMEMEVIGYNQQAVACMINMLVKKPHDIAMYNSKNIGAPIIDSKRDLLKLIDINQKRKKIKPIITFEAASRDFNNKNKGFRSSTFAMVIEDSLPNYDYFSADAECRGILLHPKHFPDKHAFWINKASVWGKYENKFSYYEDPQRPKKKTYYDSHLFIKIPHEIISKIFENVPIGGRK
jgi:hypothetical protein